MIWSYFTGARSVGVTKWRIRVFSLLVATGLNSGSLHAQEEDTPAVEPSRSAEPALPGLGATQVNDELTADPTEEKHNTGWAFYLDNDVLTTGDRDQDYTGGFAVTQSGLRATKGFSINGWLAGLDRFSRFQKLYEGREHFQLHSFEFGVTLFTPADISVSTPIFDDHPYASLFFIANTQQTVVPEDDVGYQSTLTIGLLGLDIAEDLQKGIHDLLGADEPKGWDNQISSGGEPTFKYTVSRQKPHFRRYRPTGGGREFKSSIEGNIGFTTDINVATSLRWGRISTPWWSFNPHQAEYINLGSPIVAAAEADGRREFYVWLGINLKYRFYNAILQGQFRDSVVTFSRSELEHVIAEGWIGVTKEFRGGWRGSLFVRGRTEEIKGPNARTPVWAGIILSRAY